MKLYILRRSLFVATTDVHKRSIFGHSECQRTFMFETLFAMVVIREHNQKFARIHVPFS